MPDVEAVVSSGVDWITQTEVEGPQADDLMLIAEDIVQEWLPDGSMPGRWGFQGYKGRDYGPIKFGMRKQDEAILMISGDLAREVYPAIPLNHERITRIDLQATVALRDRDVDVAGRLYNSLRNLTETPKTGKLPTYISSMTGDSLYLGKRSHPKYFRFYDKSIDYKMKQTGWAWRYEVEFKKHAAKSAAKAVSEMTDPYAQIATLVWAEFNNVGVNPAYRPTTKIVAMETSIEAKTVDSKVRWLEKCVAPVIVQLVNLGYEEQVAHALKLRAVELEDFQDGSK